MKNYVNAKFKLLKSQIKGSFAYVKRDDKLITKRLKKNKYNSKIYKVWTSNLNKKFDKITNKYFISDSNKENLSFIFKIASKLKLNNKKLIETINKFKGLDYRQQIIFDKKNLTIINDSKSTSFASSENILKNLNNVYWILGGIPKKGDKFKLSKIKALIFLHFIFESLNLSSFFGIPPKIQYASFKFFNTFSEEAKLVDFESLITIRFFLSNIICCL